MKKIIILFFFILILSFVKAEAVVNFIITASAGANGNISPSGSVSVVSGGNQTFTITPNACNMVLEVLVDGSSVGAVITYTFTNVTAVHSISVTFIHVADGTACNDGNACTQTDVCQAGVCTGTNPIVCTASDQCHLAGTCNPATGVCSNPTKTDGTACNDGNACTQTDICQAGVCTGTNPIVCTASDQCHLAGTCNPATGVCSNPTKADGTACNDGNACTQTDICQAGVCTGTNPIVCTASDQCHLAGTCNPATGVCSNPTKADGTACNDGNACTQTDVCQAGICTGTNPIVCTASDQCHSVGTCNPATGVCSNPTAANGTSCNDGNACTQADVCQAGVCIGVNISTIINSQSTATQTQCQNGIFTPITVTATGANLIYHWYSNTNADTTGGTTVGTDSNSYTSLTTTVGTLYYYCVVHGDCGLDQTSAISGAFIVNPNYNITSNKTICLGDSVIVGTHTYNTTGVYTDHLTTALGCDSIMITNLTVNPLPANAGTITGTDTICPGQSSVKYNVPAIANATTYVWTFPPGATGTSTADSITVSFGTTAASGNITVKGNNSCGNGGSSTFTVTVNSLPANAGTIYGTATVCQGQSSVIYNVLAIANATSYTWTLPTGATGSSTSNSITVDYGTSATSGNITVKGTNTCGDGTTSTRAITVNPIPPTPTISLNANTITSNATSGNQWYNAASGIISGATAQTYNPTANGYYYVIVTVNGCSSDSSIHYYYSNVGIQENVNKNTIKVYPNPATDELIIETNLNTEQRFEIINLLGQTIYTSNINKKATVNTSTFASGVYILKLYTDKEIVVKKFVKE